MKEAGNYVDAARLDFAAGSCSVVTVRMQKSHHVSEELTIFWARKLSKNEFVRKYEHLPSISINSIKHDVNTYVAFGIASDARF